MPRVYKCGLKRKPYRKHDPENLAKAVEAFDSKQLSVREAAKKYDIHYSVIYRHSKFKDTIKSQGGQPVLNENEEAFIVNRLQICADWGYPLDSFSLRMIIKQYLDSLGRNVKKFKNNIPGRDFAYSFLNRHKKEISEKVCQNIKRNRAAVSRETLTEYFERLAIELKDVPPQNNINYDETNLRDDPGKKKVIVKRGCKYPERIMNSSKSSTSLMFSVSGDGTMLPPYVVYKAVHLYDSWTAGGPKYTRYNRTKSGWFDSMCFEDWVRTVAVPYCKGLTGKKFLIGDNLSSHISMEAINLCLEHDIHFIFLPSNSTHLTQPLDVAFFAPLKRSWREILANWKLGAGRNMSCVPKDKFPRLLKKLIKTIKITSKTNITSGFRKCGIIPLNKDEVLAMLPTEAIEASAEDQAALERELLDKTFISVLRAMRYEDAASVKPKKRSKLNVLPGKSVGVEHYAGVEDSVSSDSEEEIFPKINENSGLDEHVPETDMIDTDEMETDEESYPLQIKPEELKTDDWIAVHFIYSSNTAGSSLQANKNNSTNKASSLQVNKNSSNKAGSSFQAKKGSSKKTEKTNWRVFVGQIKSIKDGAYETTILRTSASKKSAGFVYRYPKVEDISTVNFTQIIGKLRLPEKCKRGLLKFDFNADKYEVI